MIPDFDFIQSGWGNFQDIPGRLTGNICQAPGARQDRINDNLFGIDPDDAKIHENEHHMDGSVKPAVARLNQHQAFIRIKAGTERQAA